jgi:hypothetical protein
VAGSRDDILKHTRQPYVWTWCYPCGHCANYDFIQKKIASAGYIVARNYPNEAQDGHLMPDLQTWDANPLNAGYTQVVQKRGGSAKTERIDVRELNAKFDEVYEKGGIYNFMSHPQWLDYGPDSFYEQHLAHVARRNDVWYVPMGPLYAWKRIRDEAEVSQVSPGTFRVSCALNPKAYDGSLTLDFEVQADMLVFSGERQLPEVRPRPTDRWTGEYVRRDGRHLYVTVTSNTLLRFRPAAQQ